MWSMAVFICISFALGMGSYLLNQYQISPTVINVLDTHQPLYTIPFPTITVCSGTRIKRNTARQILSRYLTPEIPFKIRENIMLYLMSSLSLMQFPNYNLMKPYLRSLEAKQVLHHFTDLNITDFMLKVMPACEEVFHTCFWHGSAVKCCEIFLLQRTEEGFCWSFNSLTAQDTLHCPLSEVLENEGVLEEDNRYWPECQLRRSTGISTGSGLEIFLRPSDSRDNIGYRAQRVINGVSILIHSSYEFPHSGIGVFAPNSAGCYMSLALTAELTMSNSNIRSLAVEERNCVFMDEEHLSIHHVYSKATCRAECRFKYILLMCRCKLYFFALQDSQIPDCGIFHLSCITKHSDKFLFHKPPEGTPGITDREVTDSMSCTCRPTCYDAVFDVQIQRTNSLNSSNLIPYAHIDIYYSKTGFVRYQRQLVFEFIYLIGALGGVANLFLGFSLLSLIETIYWIYKLLVVIIKTYTIKKQMIKVRPLAYID